MGEQRNVPSGWMLGKKYEIIRKIGAGSMGEVYLAKSLPLGKEYAVKFALYDEERERLRKEAECLTGFDSRILPYVVDVLDMPEYTAMVFEYIEGINFEAYLKEKAPLAAEEASAYAGQICEILAYLHMQRPPVVYQDLKPANMILQRNGQLRLVDFGAAFSGYAGNSADFIAGTRGYCAPEQRNGGKIGPYTDIYALGALLYYMLTGNDPALPPYGITDLRKEPVMVPSGLCRLVDACCREDAAQRIQNADDVLHILKRGRFRRMRPGGGFWRLVNRVWLLGYGACVYLVLFFPVFRDCEIELAGHRLTVPTGLLDAVQELYRRMAADYGLFSGLQLLALVFLVYLLLLLHIPAGRRRNHFIRRRKLNLLYTEMKRRVP